MMENNDNSDILYVCRAASCKKNGSEGLIELLEKVLKTKIDSELQEHLIKIQSTHCLGQCPHGPNVRANSKTYTGVDRQVLKKVLVIMKSKLVKK